MKKSFILVCLLWLGLLLAHCTSTRPENKTNEQAPTEEVTTSPKPAPVTDQMKMEDGAAPATYEMRKESQVMKRLDANQAPQGLPQPEMMPTDQEPPAHNTDEYGTITENTFTTPQVSPLSTFSIDVDHASYSNVRQMLQAGSLPYRDAVRIEEFVNYFDYNYPNPTGAHPFGIHLEAAPAPWNPQHQLVMVGLQGKKLDYDHLAPCNLVFLVDVSGSMEAANKLPLLRSSLKLLVGNLTERDRISIVAYAGAAGLVLPATPANRRDEIFAALDRLNAGGSTAGGEGILLAYQVAKQNLIANGNNRIVLCTDGDFNVGVSSTSELVRLVQDKRQEGIYLTLCGFGMGNYKDHRMEELSRNGDGNYYYIDNLNEARKVFVKEMRATLFTIAKDVKIQVEFNPARVQAYRLIGYENRLLKSEDFNDDKKDAGELGAGHTVTALYEIIPVGVKSDWVKTVDPLRYQPSGQATPQPSADWLTVKFRYKKPGESTSQLLAQSLQAHHAKTEAASENFRFAAAVAGFGMLLRGSEFKGQASYELVSQLATGAKGTDPEGYRREFIQMVDNWRLLARK
ncbi:MAG: VWA domain-containing protein [Bernardetiaceae bacterium]|jgi:Ca-activated chloride channel family protein|nr:VWA domain-containing protein [Bernardetiaceae bacterium]